MMTSTHPLSETLLNNESESTPLQYQRFFGGAGLKRKRVEFVPATSPSEALQKDRPRRPLGDVYLSIVRPSTQVPPTLQHDETDGGYENIKILKGSNIQPGSSQEIFTSQTSDMDSSSQLCPICHLLLPEPSSGCDASSIPHELTLPHEIALAHSHPPSALDRRSKGLSYLSSYGWDPDARFGLGATGEGRLDFVKDSRRQTGDVRGIGVDARDDDAIGTVKAGQEAEKRRRERVRENENEKESAKSRELRKKKEMERLKALIYGRDDVNKMLGIEL